MRSVIVNLNGIRPPITGIGRYAIELLRCAQHTTPPITAAYGNELLTGKALSELLDQFEQPNTKSKQSWRNAVGMIPFSRRIYRYQTARQFTKLARPAIKSGALFHDINYSSNTQTRADLVTVYDVSNKTCAETHPHHRVKFLNDYFADLAASTSHIVAISQSVKSELVEFYGIGEHRIGVTHLAADATFYPRTETDCEQILSNHGLRYKSYLLCVGTREPRKNLAGILQAYESLDAAVHAEYPLVIAGATGWKNNAIEQQINRLKQRALVIDIGFVSQQHLPILYAAAKAFVYPSLYEGFGLPLLEAMQSGCPCITSNYGALAEVSQQHSLEVDPTNTNDIANSLNRLLVDHEQNNQYGLKGIERAKDFNWTNTHANTLKLYDELSTI